MRDIAHEWTDGEIGKLQRRFDKAYGQAAKEMRQKLDDYLSQYGEANDQWRDLLRSGDVTEEQYKAWLRSQSLRRDYLVDMCDTLARDATRTNQLATDMINDELPMVYAENANYAAYGIESQLRVNTHAFDLVDQSTVRRLMGMPDDGQVIKEVTLDDDEVSPPLVTMRKLNIDEAKDVRWNRQKFNAALTQSILQGESIPNTAKRMAGVLNMGRNMAVRAARTAMTSAENAGRVDSYQRAKRLGIDLEQEWLATLDERTRHSHRELDGQHVPVGEKFKVPSSGHELEFPGDPTAHPSEVWNCFIGETTICADSQIEKSYCHEYEGELVTIDTATGVHFTCTPNHPILTTCGWVPAKSLHDGDNLLVTGVRDSKVSRGNPHVDHVFPSMKALHELLCVLSSKRAAGLSVNFHGDVATSNVEVVAKESLLRLGINTSRFKRVIELALKGTDHLYLGKRPSMEGILRVPLSASRVMRRLRVCASLLWGHGLHADMHGLRTSTRLDSSVTEYAIDNLPAETMVRSELLSGLSGQVLSDEVIGVKVGYTRGTQVYNLQTGNGYYFANQSDNGNFIIAKNCRCTLVAWFPEDAEESLEGRFSRLPDGMTYDEWKALKQAESATEGQTEEQLEARVRELDDIVMQNTNLPTTYSDNDTYADYLQERADELRSRMDEYSWAADLDEDELERESMRRYDEYDRKFAELTERQGKLGWSDPEYEAIDREKDRLLEWLDEIDDKIDAVRSYKRASSEYDDVFARLQSRLEQNRVERETALANRETLRQSILERNRVVAELSSAQGFAKPVREALGDDFADSMERVIESARERHPEIADMYTKFSSQFKVSESRLTRTAHYNPSDFGIHFNAARDEAGSDWEPRYGTAFHEFGHLIDNLSRHRGYSSGRYGDGWGWSTRDAELTSVIKKDWTRFRNEQGKRLGVRRDKNEAVIRMLREEKRALGDDGDIVFSDVSDIIEGCTRVSYPLGAGHGASYHRSSDYHTGLEFFAETCAAAMTNERSYQQMRRIFPNAVDIVERIAREMF